MRLYFICTYIDRQAELKMSNIFQFDGQMIRKRKHMMMYLCPKLIHSQATLEIKLSNSAQFITSMIRLLIVDVISIYIWILFSMLPFKANRAQNTKSCSLSISNGTIWWQHFLTANTIFSPFRLSIRLQYLIWIFAFKEIYLSFLVQNVYMWDRWKNLCTAAPQFFLIGKFVRMKKRKEMEQKTTNNSWTKRAMHCSLCF